ncbi:DUF1643 domain-containing protein [Aureibacillus halotolerans]|uniref:DUF1643 domain-containing protein n=1 Tax=Aureibacillus halotolerans TaxID=1508390 RepID=A0A4R6TTH6_9BACI|nr:DUF1643 domain-containing protein [Aureibacillus halotolerans]TDQ35263.1 hypothetical protein EV213_12250 [Aureibacillus halotolerans]
MRSDAIFDEKQPDKYRYWLERVWDENIEKMLFILLNPSTADEAYDDRTTERCIYHAKQLGYGGMEVVNVFALRSTDKGALKVCSDPIGPGNDQAIIKAIIKASYIIVGWGEYGSINNRNVIVEEMLADKTDCTFCFRKNNDESPVHPLYVSYSTNPIPYFQ